MPIRASGNPQRGLASHGLRRHPRSSVASASGRNRHYPEAQSFCFASSCAEASSHAIGCLLEPIPALRVDEQHGSAVAKSEQQMKALAWHGKGDIRCEEVPDPKIEHPRDAIIKVTACAICGSDLHIYGGIIPDMKKGDVLGHENMGEVVEVGSENKALKVGDRVVVPFTISCGECFFCRNGFYSGCERTNPDHEKAAKLWGNSPAGLFGYSHLLGGYAGGQAEYLQGALCRRGPDQGAGEPQRRASPLPVRHLSHRIHGGRFLQFEGRRDCRDLGLRTGRAVCHPERLPPGRGTCSRHRYSARAARSCTTRPAPRRSIS